MPAAQTLEIELLEKRILRGWHYFSRFETALQQERREVEVFLDNYMARMGRVTEYAAEHPGACRGEGGETPDSRDMLHFQQKKLYRQLVKRCHPDAVSERELPERLTLLRLARRAYAEGDGQRLCALALRLERRRLPRGRYHAWLHSSDEALQAQVRRSREALQALRQSPEYRLRRKLAQAQECGMDLLELIARRLISTV